MTLCCLPGWWDFSSRICFCNPWGLSIRKWSFLARKRDLQDYVTPEALQLSGKRYSSGSCIYIWEEAWLEQPHYLDLKIMLKCLILGRYATWWWWFSCQVMSNPMSCDPMDCSLPGSAHHGVSWQEYRSRLLFPFSRDLPNPGIKSGSAVLQEVWIAGGFFTYWVPREVIV